MPLTPEQQERIAEEERLRVEEELYRARVRERYRQELARGQQAHIGKPPAGSPARVKRRNRHPWVYMAMLVVLSAIVSNQFGLLRRPAATRNPVEVAQMPSQSGKEARAVFGGPPPAPKLPPTETMDPVTTGPVARVPVPPATRTAAPNATIPLPETAPPKPVPDTATRNRIPASAAVPDPIQSVLRRWEDSIRNGDADAQASLYGPTAEVYFTKRNVPHQQIVADKRQMLQAYPKFNRYTVSNVRLESLTDNRAVVSLIKDWDAQGAQRFAGSEKELLTFARVNGDWKIIGEKEVRVFWRKKD